MAAARNMVRRAVKMGSVGYDIVRPPERGVSVLAYHRVGGTSGLDVDLPVVDFDAQMEYLATEKRAVSIDDGLDAVEQAGPRAEVDPVVITFDDGTVDFMEQALPILVKHQVPATYYIATKFIDEQIAFPDQGVPMTWSALSEAISTGLVTIGSHTHSHAVFDKLDVAAATEEIRRSVDLIGHHLGVAADHFAYPKGVFGGARNEGVLAEHFRSAALANCRSNPYGQSNPLRLERAPIQCSDGFGYFRRKVDHGMRLEGELRAALNRRRYESATN